MTGQLMRSIAIVNNPNHLAGLLASGMSYKTMDECNVNRGDFFKCERSVHVGIPAYSMPRREWAQEPSRAQDMGVKIV